MRVIAAGEDVVCTSEVDRVAVELAKIRGRRAIDVRAAVLERVEAAVEALGQVWNRAAEMTQRPADPWETFDDPAEDERGGGKRRVEEKAAERHQPVLLHHVDVDGMRRVDVQDGAEF